MRRWIDIAAILLEAEHPDILYHSTSARDREGIMREGLLRRKSHGHQEAMAAGFGEDEGPFGGIFFASKLTDDRKHGIDTWQVDVRGLHLQPDDTTDPEDPDDTWWVTYDEDVPPDRLKLVYAAPITEAAMLAESVETADLTTRSGNHLSVRLYWNPSARALLNILTRSEDDEMRGLLIDPNTAVFWDSWYAQHELVAQWLNARGYDIPFDGSANMLVMGKFRPKPVIYGDDEQAPVIRRLASLFQIGGD